MLYVIYWCGLYSPCEIFVRREDRRFAYFNYCNEQVRSACFWLGAEGEGL